MSQTIIEKIFSQHAGKRVNTLEKAKVKIDCFFSDDVTTLAIIEKLKTKKINRPLKNYFLFCDHYSPASNVTQANIHSQMRKFAIENKAQLYDVGRGISHQLMLEDKHVYPLALAFTLDFDHSFSGGIDAAVLKVEADKMIEGLISGYCELIVPDTCKINLNGKLPKGLDSKDIILYLSTVLKKEDIKDKVVEFSGSIIDKLSLEDKFVLTTAITQLSARLGLINYDKSCKYDKELSFDLDKISAYVAKPHSLDNVEKLSKFKEVAINQAFIGTACGGQLRDLEIAAKVLKGKKVKSDIKLFISPASVSVLLAAIEKKYIRSLLEAGAIILTPGYGPAVGSHQGVPADSEVVIANFSNNSLGIMGNPTSQVYLASTLTVVRSAITGKISGVNR